MKKFTETTFGIILFSIIPAIPTYWAFFDVSIKTIYSHFETHSAAYIALFVWGNTVFFLLIRKSILRQKHRMLLLVNYIEKLREETFLHINNAESTESDWRKSLVKSLNNMLSTVVYKNEKKVGEISIESLESKQLSFLKSEVIKTLEKEINNLREKLREEIT